MKKPPFGDTRLLALPSLLTALCWGCGPQAGEPVEGDATRADAAPLEVRAEGGTGHRAFRVMTYNVRGPLDTGVRAWPNRKAAVIERILANNADIVGVQEAQHPSGGPDVPADLIAGLTGTGKPYGVYNPGGGSPKLIFFKTSRFEIASEVGHGNEALVNPYATTAGCYSHAQGKKISWVGLRDLTSGQVYFVANTHFAYAAECFLGRLKEAAQMGAFLATKPAGLPVVAMGDFNSDAQSVSTRDESTIADLEAAGHLFRTARHDGTTGVDEATFNSAWDGTPSSNYARLDYIFHSGGAITSSAPSIDRTESGGNTPSDHFAVLATIRPSLFAAGSTLSPVPSGASAATRLFFADVTGDGCADRISWNPEAGEGETWVAKSKCDGSFAPAVKNAGAVSVVATTRFFFADVTGDGCADKVLWRPTLGDGEVRIYPSRCDGTFGDRVSFFPAASQSESTRLFFADVTGDGCADLLRWNPNERGGAFETFIAKRGTTPSFGAAVLSKEGANTSEFTRVYFADVDGDGKADRLLWNPGQDGGRTRVYRSAGTGAFAFAFAHEAGTSGVDTSRFYFADVDGDGKADKLFWRPTFREGRMQIYPGTGTGFAGSPVMDNTGFSGSENTDFFFANIDGQGGADKVYWNPSAYNGDSKVFRALAQ
ncbi:FG-GAP-like repeat-containing protein [Stigmatella erecta]|uniref:Metal-dependent hydrolase, endonuclease/exonuclease/phosphatase family n=1 Tax=Stigmatella erecta TaxID=83460 RepID=A0A1H9YR47_9BACT|nr:FG-GAP-like repeat-containing protein [Stigmatella erecta]SES71636.1 Metal-dependent hydrolase, endonuclease/exonuclease/phosphatase family [Stigmatella erecta]